MEANKYYRRKGEMRTAREDIVTVTGSKWEKEKKRWSEVRKSKPLDEEIKDDISTRKKDRGQLIKQKNPPLDALEHRARRKERQASEA
jgi:hypothetical protein